MSWHKLYLLPSAPLELAEEVYRRVSVQLGHAQDGPAVGAGLAELREAHSREVELHTAQAPGNEQPLAQRRPWELLHVRPDAPPEIVDLAYRYWAERVPGRTVDVIAQQKPSPAAAVREQIAPQSAPSAVVERAVAQGAFPCLRRAAGDALLLGGRPLRIGGDPTCDVVVAGVTPATEARVWVNDGRAVLHGLGGVLVNGEPAGWAVLDDGDALQVGAETFRFEGSPK